MENSDGERKTCGGPRFATGPERLKAGNEEGENFLRNGE